MGVKSVETGLNNLVALRMNGTKKWFSEYSLGITQSHMTTCGPLGPQDRIYVTTLPIL